MTIAIIDRETLSNSGYVQYLNARKLTGKLDLENGPIEGVPRVGFPAGELSQFEFKTRRRTNRSTKHLALFETSRSTRATSSG